TTGYRGPLVSGVPEPIPRGDVAGLGAARRSGSNVPLARPTPADSDRSGEQGSNSRASLNAPVGAGSRVPLFAPHSGDSNGSGEHAARPGGRGESWSRSAGPPQARRHPLGGSAQVLLRRGAVITSSSRSSPPSLIATIACSLTRGLAWYATERPASPIIGRSFAP